jgi:uncharacterized protein
MAVNPTYPGVYIEELPSAVHPITGVATSIGAFVGYTARGIDQRAQQIFSYSDYERLYGGLASNSELSYAVQQFFANGGNQAWVVRVPRVGASGAMVVFDALTFTALSSGVWANGELLIDVDYNGIAQPLANSVTVTNGLATVTGLGFQTTLEAGEWLVFASDPTQTPYQIETINSNTSLTLGADYAQATPAGSIVAAVITDPTAFNLTITDLVDGTTESFPDLSLNNTYNNFIANVVNDPDNGSQLVNVAVGNFTANEPPPQTGTVGTAPVVATLNVLLGGQVVSPTVTLAGGHDTVTGTFATVPTALGWLVFPSDPTLIPYQIAALPAPTTSGVTLTANFTGTITSSAAVSVTAVDEVTLTANSAAVTCTAGFLSNFTVGQTLLFASDTTQTFYQILSINSDTSLTLTQKYTGAIANPTTAMVVNGAVYKSGSYGIELGAISPTTAPFPLPIPITVFAGNAPISQTVSGLASQLQKAINSALAVQMPGASVVCSASGFGAGQAIRVNAMLPQFPDAVITITAPPSTSGLLDASVALGLNPPASFNVAHYALGTNSGTSADAALTGTAALTQGQTTVTGTGTSFASSLVGQLLSFSLDTTDTPYQVAAAPSATSLTLTTPYAGANVSGSDITVLSWAGQQTSSTPGSDGAGLPGSAQLIGDQSAFTGIYALQNVDQFNLLCIPDATRAVPGNPAVLDSTVDPNAIYAAAIALCDSKLAFLMLDCPPYVNTVSAAVDWKTTGLTVSDPNGAAFFPRLRLPDPLNNYNLRTFAPCGVVAGLYAQTDTSRGVWKAPAGTAATLSGVQSLVYKMSDAENGVLNPLGLNCFRTFPVYGSVLWGARTLVGADAETSQWKYVPIRRVALFLEASLYQGTQWVVFEPNDEPLWSAIRLNIGSFMQNLFQQGYFQGSTPAQAYFVKCDSETTTQTDIDNGVVNIVVGFAPLYPAEFVIIQIQQMAGQTGS